MKEINQYWPDEEGPEEDEPPLERALYAIMYRSTHLFSKMKGVADIVYKNQSGDHVIKPTPSEMKNFVRLARVLLNRIEEEARKQQGEENATCSHSS